MVEWMTYWDEWLFVKHDSIWLVSFLCEQMNQTTGRLANK